MSSYNQQNQHVENQYNANSINFYAAPLSLTDAQRLQNRKVLLERVRSRWITGLLEPSLHGVPHLSLQLYEQPDAVRNPWILDVQELAHAAYPWIPNINIAQIYDRAGGELLILGKPGSGKTILLLELLTNLLERAQHENTHPIPVVFNLTSWAVKRKPIIDWIIEELHDKYEVEYKVGQSWVYNNQILLLLDGLDEVNPEFRVACMYAINTYRSEHGLVPMVVCSRSTDYLERPTRLLLRNAIVVQPLTKQQIEQYLSSIDEQLAELYNTLQTDPIFQELVTTPLILYVLTQVSREESLKDILTVGSLETRIYQVFATYVERMLTHRSKKAHYTSQQTRHWLTWLAKQLVQHNQTEFYIERMQPDWLSNNRSYWIYRIAVGLTIGLFAGISIGMVVSLILMLSLSLGMSGGTIGEFILEIVLMLIPWLIIGLIVGLIVGTISALIGAVISVLLGNLGHKSAFGIKPAETIRWSKNKAQRGLGHLLIIGGSIGIGSGVGSGMAGGLDIGLVVGFVCGLGIIMIIGFIRGLSAEMLDEHNFGRPNQGIRLSVYHAILIALFSLILGSVGGLADGLFQGLNGLIFLLPLLGLIVGLICGSLNGGIACIKHACLRILIWRRYGPLNYPHFLDYAVERILLRKVGGGYIFVHHMLMEYFATLNFKQDSDDL